MGLPSLPFRTQLPSRQLISGAHINGFNDMFQSFQGAIVALAGGALSALTPTLNARFCEIGTVANANDSVKLPPAIVGLVITVTNSGANSAQIFGSGSDTVQGQPAATGVALAAAATAEFQCTKTGVWKRFVSS